MEKKQTIHDNGTVESTVWQCNGIKLGHTVSIFNDFTCFSASNHKDDVVRLHFGLKGNYSFHYKQLNHTYDLLGGHHNIMYSPGFDMQVWNRTLQLETFGVQFPKPMFLQFTQNADDRLKRFSENVANGRCAMLSDIWGAIDAPVGNVIQQIINNKYTSDLQRLFLLSKSIELIVLCANTYEGINRKELFIKTKADKEKIIAARDFVKERLHCPPSLSEIARAVGLNEYKLKRGFKETFNNTVFGYLTDLRLNLAYQYLQDTDKTAAEISLELGYATPQHFNNSFKKKFGITPFLVRNNP